MSIQNIDNATRRNFIGGVFSASAFVLAADLLPETLWADTSEYLGKAAASAQNRVCIWVWNRTARSTL